MLLAAGALRALWLSAPPAPVLAAASLASLALLARELGRARHPGTLVHDGAGGWRLEGFGLPPFEGRLLPAGYRGAALVVLVLEGAPRDAARRSPATLRALHRRLVHPPRRRLAIHVDSVRAIDFSWLHLHLALPDDGAGAPP